MLSKIAFLLLFVALEIHGYSYGPSCEERTPQLGHGNSSGRAENTGHYTLRVTPSCYRKGSDIIIRITSNDTTNYPIKGYRIDAGVHHDWETEFGSFGEWNNGQHNIICPANRAVTHKENSPKKRVEAILTAPSRMQPTIPINVIIVKGHPQHAESPAWYQFHTVYRNHCGHNSRRT